MTSTWDSVVGQDHAVSLLRQSVNQPVHAYLFVGSEGCGKEDAARAFAAELLAGTDDMSDRVCSLVMRGGHVDVHEIYPEGTKYRVKEEIAEIQRLVSLTPVESKKKCLIIYEGTALTDVCAGKLLKTLEEPPEGTHFIIVAEQLDDVPMTITSRCFVTRFATLEDRTIATALVNLGVAPDRSESIARASHGNITRARLLTTDSQLLERLKFFADVPRHIDGTGAAVARIVDEATELIAQALDPLVRAHEQEVANWEQRVSLVGGSRRGKKEMEERHKREVRKYRTDEIRAGLAEIANTYRDAIVNNPDVSRPEIILAAIERIHAASGRLSLNVNETLLLRDVIWSLPSLKQTDTLVFD